MIRMRSWDEAKSGKRPRRHDNFEGFITDFIETADSRSVVAQAYLVEQNPNWVTPPHFHLEHQFQVVTAGSGAIGRHAVQPLAVHYASPETGYGPITAGPEGVSYLTLRARADTGAWYLHSPEQRARMQRGLKKQQEYGSPGTTITAAELRSLAAPFVEELIAPQESGLAAHLVRLPPDETLALPRLHAHAGRFYVTTSGSMRVDGRELRAIATVFASFDEAFAIAAGSGGLEVLVLQFPRDAVEGESSPTIAS